MLISFSQVILLLCTPAILLVLNFFGSNLQHLNCFLIFRELFSTKVRPPETVPVCSGRPVTEVKKYNSDLVKFVKRLELGKVLRFLKFIEIAKLYARPKAYSAFLPCNLTSKTVNFLKLSWRVTYKVDSVSENNFLKAGGRRASLVQPKTNFIIDYAYSCGVEKWLRQDSVDKKVLVYEDKALFRV